MKNVDLKKRYKEGKTACKILPNLSIFAIYFFLLFSNSLAQVPINGFCKIQSYNTQPRFSKLFALNYNLDDYTDLLLFGLDGKKIVVHPGDDEKIILGAIQKFSYFTIDDLAPLDPLNSENRFYIFVSRKERLAGLISFTKYGTMQILNQIKFDSYPGNVHVGDVDGDGKNEALISGMNFNGLSILREENYILRETKIVEGKVFKDAKLIDLDYDSFSDIAAFDLFANSIVFYYNIEFDEFREYRSIEVDEVIDELKIADYNNDNYDDLLYHHGSGIEIMLGDSVSTFKDRVFFKTGVSPDAYVVHDFNKDGFNDIAYMNRDTGDLYITYAKSTDTFFEPIHYLHNAGLEDMIGFRNGLNEYLAVLNNCGEIYIISRFVKPEDEMYIAIGGIPAAITSFDSFVSDMRDICFIDSYSNNLNLLINDKYMMYSKYYQFRLSDQHTNILVDDTGESVRTFYLYSYDHKFIEMISLDFTTDKFSKDCLYTYSAITDLRLDGLTTGDHKSLYVLVKQDSSLSMINYEYRDFKYTAFVSRGLKSRVIDAGLAFTNTPSIYYWNISNGLFKNGHLKLDDSSEPDSSIMIIPGNQNTISSIFIQSFNFLYMGKYLPVSVINEDQSTSFYYFDGTSNKKGIFEESLMPVTDKNQIQLFSNPIGRKSFLYLYDSGNETLYQAEVPVGKEELRFYKLFESMHSNSYFVNNLFFGKTYLIYTESTSNSIKLKRIE